MVEDPHWTGLDIRLTFDAKIERIMTLQGILRIVGLAMCKAECLETHRFKPPFQEIIFCISSYKPFVFLDWSMWMMNPTCMSLLFTVGVHDWAVCVTVSEELWEKNVLLEEREHMLSSRWQAAAFRSLSRGNEICSWYQLKSRPVLAHFSTGSELGSRPNTNSWTMKETKLLRAARILVQTWFYIHKLEDYSFLFLIFYKNLSWFWSCHHY